MPIYVYGCSHAHRTEYIRPVGTTHADCGACGELCGRVYGYSLGITQPEVDLRSMTRRFIEASEEMGHRAERTEEATGRTVARPDFVGAGRQRAEALRRSGEGFRPLS